MSNVITALQSVDLVIAVGSGDGVLTAAAVKRLSGRPNLEVCFTQAFQVNQLPVGSWSGRKVVLVDLAVNNRDKAMTAALVDALREGDNTLLAVIDEHDAGAWEEVLGNFDGLAVAPQTRDQADLTTPQSAAEVLRRALVAEGVDIDAHTAALLSAADASDRMDFSPELASVVNRAVKSAIGDNRRRVHLVDLLAAGPAVDDTVRGWVAEYEEMEANAAFLLANSIVDLGDGIVRVDTGGRRVDVTTLLFALYKRARVVVVTGATAYNPAAGKAVPVVTVATGDKTFDVLSAVKEAGVPAGGFAAKANIDPADDEAAIDAVRAALKA